MSKSVENGFGAASRAVLVDGLTSELPQSRFILALVGVDVCDNAHWLGVMKTNQGRWKWSFGEDGSAAIPDGRNQRQRQRTGVSALHEHLLFSPKLRDDLDRSNDGLVQLLQIGRRNPVFAMLRAADGVHLVMT